MSNLQAGVPEFSVSFSTFACFLCIHSIHLFRRQSHATIRKDQHKDRSCFLVYPNLSSHHSSSVVVKAHTVNFSNKDEKTILCYILMILISLRHMEDCGVHYVQHGQYLILIFCKLLIIFRLLL